MYFNKKNLSKNEGQHFPLADLQACPHACFLLFELLSVDVSADPDLLPVDVVALACAIQRNIAFLLISSFSGLP